MTKGNVLQESALIRVYILVAEKRPNTAKLLRYLRVEGGHVVYRRTLLVGMPDEKAFVEELDSMPDVYNVRINDRLAEPGTWSVGGVTNSVVINGSANLQTRDGFGACKQADINMIAVVLVFKRMVDEIGTNRIAGSVFGNIVQTQSPGRD